MLRSAISGREVLWRRCHGKIDERLATRVVDTLDRARRCANDVSSHLEHALAHGCFRARHRERHLYVVDSGRLLCAKKRPFRLRGERGQIDPLRAFKTMSKNWAFGNRKKQDRLERDLSEFSAGIAIRRRERTALLALR
jgi:hypothetical protein